MSEDGNPGRRSPEKVSKDRKYQALSGYQGDSYYPHACQHVVQHIETGNFWSCVYGVGVDDSDYDLDLPWSRVYKHVVTVVKFKDKP